MADGLRVSPTVEGGAQDYYSDGAQDLWGYGASQGALIDARTFYSKYPNLKF